MDANQSASSVPLERRCDNPDCTVYKMVSSVPQRSTPQFVVEPAVMEKPQLINGFTTIFQIEGKSAKLSDIKNKNPDEQKPIFRIVPNTHAHIVNYVVVDSDTESLRKIHSNDPATMRKLLESQKQSADQMLKKLIAGHGIPVVNVTNNGNSVLASSTPSQPAVTAASNTGVGGGGGGGGGGIAGTITPVAVSKLMPQTAKPTNFHKNAPLQLPTSIHPNLKITSISSGEGIMPVVPGATSVGSLLANAKKAQLQQQPQQQTVPAMPIITPVPLASLQRPSIALQSPISTPPPPPLTAISNMTSSSEIMDQPSIDKMQQELKELRRTVALLAEAQAKTKH